MCFSNACAIIKDTMTITIQYNNNNATNLGESLTNMTPDAKRLMAH